MSARIMADRLVCLDFTSVSNRSTERAFIVICNVFITTILAFGMRSGQLQSAQDHTIGKSACTRSGLPSRENILTGSVRIIDRKSVV